MHKATAGRLLAAGTLAGLAAAAGAAISIEHDRLEAERTFPPQGRFLEVEGVRLHYIDTEGPLPAVVMFHGNGAMIADLEISGLLARVSRQHRTIVFDRPGYGYSDRPRWSSWGPVAQAQLFRAALHEMGVDRAIVFGQSWGTLVALALALEHPEAVQGLVLASGYYFPEARADVAGLSAPAVPVLGGLMRHTLAPFLARHFAPAAISRMFAPLPVTEAFRRGFPLPLAFRPEQIRASSEELSLMNAAAARLAPRYGELAMPVAIIAGEADEIVETPRQSIRLAETIRGSSLHVVPEMGHMLHHFEADKVAALIEGMAG